MCTVAQRILVAAALLLLSASLQARDALDFQAMQSGKGYRGSIDLSAYAPGPDAKEPTHVFEGRLKLSGQPRTRTLLADTDYLGYNKADYAQARKIPEDFDYAFVQHGNVLIPVRRGPIPSSNDWWEFILEPGRVWDEPGDHEYSRAAIPFSLAQKNQNCVSNGVLMFLFNDKGAVSHAAMQVSSETCPYLHIDMWGFLDVKYAPGKIADKPNIVATWKSEQANRIPTQPLAALVKTHPGMDLAKLAIGDPKARKRYGLYVDGVHYVSDCPTRHGNYPYCDVLDIPSYSTAKTVVAGIAAMRMEKIHPGVMQKRVPEFAGFPSCKASRWQDVSFMNLLDMAVGNYGSSKYMADEDSLKIVALLRPITHADKMRAACASWPHQSDPGTIWVYHSSDTYLVGVALQNYLRSLPGQAKSDVFANVLVPDVYAPLHLSAGARVTRRTYDEAKQPFFGWGLFVHADDLVKLARFMGSGEGKIGAEQVLDPTMLKAAMQRDPAHRGLPVASLEKNFRYQHSVWARNVQSLLGCEKPVWVPFMSGYGGITVAMFPNGLIWYSVSDDSEIASFDFAEPAREINKVWHYCQAAGS